MEKGKVMSRKKAGVSLFILFVAILGVVASMPRDFTSKSSVNSLCQMAELVSFIKKSDKVGLVFGGAVGEVKIAQDANGYIFSKCGSPLVIDNDKIYNSSFGEIAFIVDGDNFFICSNLENKLFPLHKSFLLMGITKKGEWIDESFVEDCRDGSSK